jgi:hypothetical protein
VVTTRTPPGSTQNMLRFENSALLGYYIASSGTFLLTFRDNLPVRNYNYSLRNNAEERGSRLFRSGRLKSRTVYFITQCIYMLRYGSYNT